MPVDYCVSGIHLREIDQRSFLAVHCPTLLLTYNLHYGVKLFITYDSCKVSDIFVYPDYIFLMIIHIHTFLCKQYIFMLGAFHKLRLHFLVFFDHIPPLVCTFYVVNYTFFRPPTHLKCKRNL